MLNTNTRVGCALLARICCCHLRDHLRPTMEATLAQLQLVLTIVRVVDHELYDFLQRCVFPLPTPSITAPPSLAKS